MANVVTTRSMSDGSIDKLVKGSASRFILFVANVVSGLFMMPYLVGSLGESKYGLWVVAGTIISFYDLLDMGIFRAMHRFLMQAIYKGDEKQVEKSIATNFVLGCIIGLLSILITLGIVFSTEVFVKDEGLKDIFASVVLLLGFKASIDFPMYSFFGILMARYKYYIISNVHLIALLVRLGFIVLLVEAGYGVLGLAVASVFTLLFAQIVVVVLAVKELGMGFPDLRKFDYTTLKEYASFGKFTYVIGMSRKISNSLDALIVNSLFGLSAVTFYSVAQSLIQHYGSAINSILGVFSSLLNKYVAEDSDEKLRGSFLSMSEISLTICLYIAGGMFLVGEEFIVLWMGVDFSEAYVVLLILLVPALLSGSQIASLELLIAKGEHKNQAYISILEVFMNLTLSVYLGGVYGVFGVALATLISISLNSLLFLPMYACKKVNISLLKYYLIHFRGWALVLISVLLVEIYRNYIDVSGYVEIFSVGISYSVVYFTIYYVFIMDERIKWVLNDFLLRRKVEA